METLAFNAGVRHLENGVDLLHPLRSLDELPLHLLWQRDQIPIAKIAERLQRRGRSEFRIERACRAEHGGNGDALPHQARDVEIVLLLGPDLHDFHFLRRQIEQR